MLTHDDVLAAAHRVAGRVRPAALATTAPGELGPAPGWLVLEQMQHTGSFKARGAMNFVRAHLEAGDLPDAGLVIASGGNAGLANAWAAGEHGVPVTVFLPENAPAVKQQRLRALGADLRLVGREYAEAAAAAAAHARETGALASHAYDDPFIAAGAGTLAEEVAAALPGLDTLVVAVGGGGLFGGTVLAAAAHGVRVVAVEPAGAQALHAAVAAGGPVDVPVESVAADSLGARRVSATAARLAVEGVRRGEVACVLVDDGAIVEARRALWSERRVVAEHGAATALAAIRCAAYVPAPGERVAVVVCGANTDPVDLTAPPA